MTGATATAASHVVQLPQRFGMTGLFPKSRRLERTLQTVLSQIQAGIQGRSRAEQATQISRLRSRQLQRRILHYPVLCKI